MGIHCTITDVRRLCCLGLDSHLVMPSLLQMLHDLIPSRSNLFFWIDKDFEISDLYAEESVPPETIHLYLSEFYNRREMEVCPPFSQAARLERGITDWEQYLSNDPFICSDFYNQIMLPQKARYILRAYVAIDGQNAGLLLLQRGPNDGPFTNADKSLLARVTPYIANTLKGSNRTEAITGGSWKSGLMLLDQQLDILGADTVGRHLLSLANSSKINAVSFSKNNFTNIPYALREQLSKLAALSAPETSLQIQNQWGTFLFNTYIIPNSTMSSPLLGVTIAHLLPRQVMLILSMKASSLSGKQKEVCLWLLEGYSQQDIAIKMGISQYSVNDYLKAAYRKLEVHSKEALLRKLLMEAA